MAEVKDGKEAEAMWEVLGENGGSYLFSMMGPPPCSAAYLHQGDAYLHQGPNSFNLA